MKLEPHYSDANCVAEQFVALSHLNDTEIHQHYARIAEPKLVGIERSYSCQTYDKVS